MFGGIAMDDLIMFGGEIKALGDGKLGGYLVLFGDAAKTDLTGDYFTAKTDFGAHTMTPVLYDHGLDGLLKRRVLDPIATLKTDDVGVWVDAQLAMRDDYEKAIYALATQKKLGWSSGTASHLVEREAKGTAFHITRWPLGLDASLTPTPAESRTQAVPLKTLYTEIKSSLLTGLDFDDHSDTVLTAMREYVDRASRLCERRTREGRTVSDERRSMFKGLSDDILSFLQLTDTEVTTNSWRALQLDFIRMEAEADGLLQGASA